ncbi:MAG: hypothetical protein HFG15_00350 [Bacilli bacterium]|nr:hypothetical protein [Bacilli bacterium]
MYKIGEHLVYCRDVCIVKEIKRNHYQGHDYYVLMPIEDSSLKIEVPIENRCGNLRDLITKDELEDIIKQIPSIPILDCHDKLLENEYKKLLSSKNHVDLIKIIKTAYLRNQYRLDQNKKLGETDNNYLEKAERYLFQEFGVVLGLDYEETKQYVIDQVLELQNN